MQKISYGGWKNCCRLSNRLVDLVATTAVGPRIIRFGLKGRENVFKEYPDQVGKTGGREWRLYGGHRLWHAPEQKPRTYYPDNSPIQAEQHAGFVRLIQPTEGTTGIQKEIDLHLSRKDAHVRVIHRLRNQNLWPVELAPWGLTVMAPGGRVIIPLPPRGSHEKVLLPTNTLTLWAYTDLSDPRWTWGQKYILLRQDPEAKHPQKIGVMSPDGWLAYAINGLLFVKKFQYRPGACYPDYGCSVETFTNADMLEVETVGPLGRLEPGAAVEHREDWFLFDNVPMPANDAAVQEHVLPRIRTARAK